MKFVFVCTVLLAVAGCSREPLPTSGPPVTHQPSGYELAGSERFALKSRFTDRTYQITVTVPGGYDATDTDTRYPSVYVLDAQWQYPLMHTLVGSVHHDGDMPYALLVGITWSDEDGDLMENRMRDLYATETDGVGNSGKAKDFESFFREELIPEVEKRYHANSIRIATGGSSSSSFLTHVLLTQPDLFVGYIPSSPAFVSDAELMPELLNDFSSDSISRLTRVYMCKGGLELDDRIDEFANTLLAKAGGNLEARYQVVTQAGHAALNAECYVRGLQFIFHRDEQLPGELLAQYSGQYGSGEERLQFSVVEGRLVYVSDDARLPLNAVDDRTFYTPGLGLRFVFERDRETLNVAQYSPYGLITRQSKQ